MTNNSIIEAISGDVREIIDNMAVMDDHKDDLFEEVILILLTYDHKKLFDVYAKGQIRFFISRILCNQYYSTHSYFFKMYKKYEVNKYHLADIIGKNGEPRETD